MPELLNQTQLVAYLHDELGIRLCTKTVHRLMAAGMPHDMRFGKRPRFNRAAVTAWILASQDTDPITLAARDKIFRRRMGATG